MPLVFPRDLILEAYLGRWVNITALAEGRSLRQVDPVVVTWGSNAEQGKIPPSVVDAVLNNQGGHWTPGNPMSDYYDFLQGRNAPTRLSLRTGYDTFDGRTVGAGWSFSSAGDQWTAGGVNSSTAVGAGVGTHTVTAVSSFAISVSGPPCRDAQVAITGSWNLNVTGGAIEPINLVLRNQDSGALAGEHYILRVSVDPAEVLTIAIYHNSFGLISNVVTVETLIPGANSRRAKFQVEGQTLRGKVYPSGPANDPDQFEPVGWQVSAHHERLTYGSYGVRTGVAAGNTNIPVTVSYDDWDARRVCHSGELAKLDAFWDPSHRIKTAKIRLADVTQRLGRPERASLSSAIRRYAASNAELAVTDFWPLDESATEPRQGLNAVAGGSGAWFERAATVPPSGAITWGVVDDVHTSVPGFVTTTNLGDLHCPVRFAGLGSSFSVMWAMQLSPDEGGKFIVSVGGVFQFVFFFYTDGTYELFGNPAGTSLATGTFPLGTAGLDGAWLTMGLSIFAVDATHIGYHINVDGQTLGVGSWASGVPYAAPAEVILRNPGPVPGGKTGTSWSSVTVTAQRFDSIIPTTATSYGSKLSNVIKGWVGERAGNRAFRMTAEEGLPFDYWGSLSDTRPMGSQRPAPLLDQLQQCADADQALLFGARYTNGVVFRGRRSLTAQAPVGTGTITSLSYSGGQVGTPFAPSADDRPTANLVRANRLDGGYVVLEQVTGPMNTGDPGSAPDAIGKVPGSARVNVESVASLGDVAGWVRALGTQPEQRFPRVPVNLRAPELNTSPGLTVSIAILGLTVGDRLKVTGLAAADFYADLDQLVRGGVEVYTSVRQHKVTVNTAPYEKYRSGVYGDAAARYDGAVTTLDAQLTSGTTGARNVTTSSGPVWTNLSSAFPLDVVIGGERCEISNVTGTGAAQVMTVSVRNKNGLPTAGGKTHPAGTRVYLYLPSYYA